MLVIYKNKYIQNEMYIRPKSYGVFGLDIEEIFEEYVNNYHNKYLDESLSLHLEFIDDKTEIIDGEECFKEINFISQYYYNYSYGWNPEDKRELLIKIKNEIHHFKITFDNINLVWICEHIIKKI